MTLKVNIST